MTSKKRIIFIFILAINLFLLSFFFSRSWVERTCCNFKSHRTYGFPLAVFSISKTTRDLSEAEKIYSSLNYELLENGWEMRLGSNSINLFWVLVFNFLFYFIASGILVGLFNVFISALVNKINKGKVDKYY